jgi:hypothetical protein
LANSQKDYTNIELLFPHDLFLKGEELYESGAITDISKIDSKLYSFTINEGVKIEVEWFKPLTRQQKASCECDFFQLGKMCRHTIAALLAYKQEFYKEKELETSDRDYPRKASTLNINSILNNLSKDDLKSFIKSYAGNDKKFAIAFKVHFARKVDLNDNELKYKSILDSIIKPITTDKNPYKASDVRGLINISEEFQGQTDDAVSLEQYQEAFILTKTTLSKLAYVYNNSQFYSSEVEKLIIKSFDHIREILSELQSVELKKEIEAFLMEMAELSFTPFISCKDNIFDILVESKIYHSQLIEFIEQQLWRHERKDSHATPIILGVLLRLKIMNGNPASLDKKYQNFFDKVGENLLKSKFENVLIKFYKDVVNHSKDLSLLYLQALTNMKSKKTITEAVEIFSKQKDLRVIDFIKSRFDQKALSDFVLNISKKKVTLNDNAVFYMNYLVKSNQFQSLLDFIAQTKNVNYLMQHTQILAKELPEATTLLYETMIENYLIEHIGEKSHNFINDVFLFLNKLQLSRITNRLGMMIDIKFPERNRLEEAIK